jgi:HPt (histidine-containing phosphotransfer) domain-containing protein
MDHDLSFFSTINVSEGLHRIGGEEELYCELLVSFYTDYEQAASQSLLLVEQGEWEEARILVHSVKGISGNLGARELYRAAAGLEQQIKSRETEAASPLFLDFQASLKAVMEEIRRSGLQNTQASGTAAGTGTFDRLMELLPELIEYARGRKARQAKDTIQIIESYNWPDDVLQSLGKIKDYMRKYKLPEIAAEAEALHSTIKTRGAL